MADLSPAARAVWEAFNSKFDWVEDGVPGPQFHSIAAALRAAADQVAPIRSRPDEPFAIPPVETMCWMREVKIRDALLAIAAELEGNF